MNKEQYIKASEKRIADWCKACGCEIPPPAWIAVISELKTMYDINGLPLLDNIKHIANMNCDIENENSNSGIFIDAYNAGKKDGKILFARYLLKQFGE